MKTKTVLTNILDNETLFSGEAEVEKTSSGSLVFTMKTAEAQMIWKLLKKGLIIENKGEFETRLTLYAKGNGQARIRTPFGEMECPIEDIRIQAEQGALKVSYLLNGADLFSFELQSDLLNENYDFAD